MRKMTIAQQWAHKARKHQVEKDPPELPNKYRQHAIVFNEKKATWFPLKCEEELSIDLLPDTPKTINCKVYPLSKLKQDQLRSFLAEEEEKGYIYKGSSPYTAPVFFIGKKDSDKQQVIMDYQKLNEWVVHDNRPLPNIRTQLEKLTRKHIFTKFDIQWGYKNHHIKKEDQPTVLDSQSRQNLLNVYFSLKSPIRVFSKNAPSKDRSNSNLMHMT